MTQLSPDQKKELHNVIRRRAVELNEMMLEFKYRTGYNPYPEVVEYLEEKMNSVDYADSESKYINK